MSRFSPLLLAPALLLSACGTYNGGVESVYQPVVQRNDYVLDLATSGYALAPGESQRLAGWLQSMRLSYGDHVAIDDGADGTTAREEIGALTGGYGILLSDKAPTTVGQIAPGTLRVVVTRMTATVPKCPDFSRVYQPDLSSSTTSNYGCSVNGNLAAMIADPADLVRGEPGSPTSDANTATKAVRALRAAAPSGAGGTTIKSDSASGGPK
ncbi:CpaD family pilus assembly protein [Sphingomonas sp. JC676]|uniref:CpaD family pilus assembly protein n=1 Tax=Sphingomonas sp. JC676 TaxID=2768065 RepID=UPI00292A584D|nr:CpaD family pilus assembly lipoprotein [Sphingomonas sp. JC676]